MGEARLLCRRVTCDPAFSSRWATGRSVRICKIDFGIRRRVWAGG